MILRNINKRNYAYTKKWQTEKRDREAMIPSEDKCQCLICGKWYIQVGSHINQVHKMTCREYREMFKLEEKLGIEF